MSFSLLDVFTNNFISMAKFANTGQFAIPVIPRTGYRTFSKQVLLAILGYPITRK